MRRALALVLFVVPGCSPGVTAACSALDTLEYSLDGGPWTPLSAAGLPAREGQLLVLRAAPLAPTEQWTFDYQATLSPAPYDDGNSFVGEGTGTPSFFSWRVPAGATTLNLAIVYRARVDPSWGGGECSRSLPLRAP